MPKKTKYKSDAFESIHASAAALHKVDAVSETTLRNFDVSCLVQSAAFRPEEIKSLREANKVSQPAFARFLNTSESTVEKWETGAKRPSGMALKLLTIVQEYGIDLLA